MHNKARKDKTRQRKPILWNQLLKTEQLLTSTGPVINKISNGYQIDPKKGSWINAKMTNPDMDYEHAARQKHCLHHIHE